MTVLTDTSGKEVLAALGAARTSRGGGASGLALTLVVVAETDAVDSATSSACVAAQAHPCRLIMVTRESPTDANYRLDAEICVDGRLGTGETVILRMHGRLALHAESITLPLLAPDVPVVAWWQGVPPEKIARDPLGVFADRRVTDCSQHPDPLTALRQRAQDYRPGDTDITWTRTTSWRSLLADAFDTIAAQPASIEVHAPVGNASAALLAGWLQSRLGVVVRCGPPADDEPEISGVTVTLHDGSTLTLKRESPNSVVVQQTGGAAQQLPLDQPSVCDALAEELRHLDPDQPYAAALQTATGVAVAGADYSGAARIHEWHDPALSASAS